MKTWIWPFSWLSRMRELESEVAGLTKRNRELEEQLRTQYIAECSMAAAYTAAVTSIAATSERAYRRARGLPD